MTLVAPIILDLKTKRDMMKQYKLIAFVLLFSLFSCSKSEVIDNERPLSQDVLSITQEADFVDALISTEQILRRSSIADREGIRENLRAAKDLVAFLDRNPGDKAALRQLETRLTNLRSLNLSERDAPRVANIFKIMNDTFIDAAGLSGYKMAEDFTYTLFQYDFVGSVAPFGISTTIGDRVWNEPIERIDIYRFSASKSNRGSEGWLISPTFDFTKTKNPGLRIKHSFNLRKNSREDEFDVQLIKRTTFKVYYSENFVSGLHNTYNVTWKELDIGKLPLGIDFHFVDTGYMRYKQFEGKKITIAFGFNGATPQAEAHFLSWDIFRFDVLGTTGDFSYKPYDATLIKAPEVPLLYKWSVQELKSSALEGFTELIREGEPGNFRVGDFNEEFFVRGSGKNLVGIVDLYTPSYDLLSTKSPYIQLRHAANHYKKNVHNEKLIKLLIAENVDGAEPQNLEWVDLDLNTNNIGRSFNEVLSDKLVIPSEFNGKKVRFAFRWTGKGEDKAPVWDLHELRIGELDD
jgi:hypothetical protein